MIKISLHPRLASPYASAQARRRPCTATNGLLGRRFALTPPGQSRLPLPTGRTIRDRTWVVSPPSATSETEFAEGHDNSELLQLAVKAYEKESGKSLLPLRSASESQNAALTSPLFNKGTANELLFTEYLSFKGLKWWGNFFAVMGVALGVIGVVAAPFSMGAGLGLAVVGGILSLIGIGITWYADSKEAQQKFRVKPQSNGVNILSCALFAACFRINRCTKIVKSCWCLNFKFSRGSSMEGCIYLNLGLARQAFNYSFIQRPSPSASCHYMQVTIIQLGSIANFEAYRRDIEVALEKQRLALKQQEHLDDLQNVEIWRQNCELALVREIQRAQADYELTLQTLMRLEEKARKTGAAELTQQFHLKLQNPVQDLQPDFSNTGMSPEFQDKLRASWGRLEEQRLKALQPYTFCISHTIYRPVQRGMLMGFTIKVKQLAGPPVGEHIDLIMSKYGFPDYHPKQDSDGTWHWPPDGRPAQTRGTFPIEIKFRSSSTGNVLFSKSYSLTIKDGSETVEYPSA